MSDAFGWEMQELEQMLVTLIEKGEISARIDKTNMVSGRGRFSLLGF